MRVGPEQLVEVHNLTLSQFAATVAKMSLVPALQHTNVGATGPEKLALTQLPALEGDSEITLLWPLASQQVSSHIEEDNVDDSSVWPSGECIKGRALSTHKG